MGLMYRRSEDRQRYPEVNLVMAEIYLKINDPANARRILTGMVDNVDLPIWVRDEARALLNGIPK